VLKGKRAYVHVLASALLMTSRTKNKAKEFSINTDNTNIPLFNPLRTELAQKWKDFENNWTT
jgi:hypothetical protein